MSLLNTPEAQYEQAPAQIIVIPVIHFISVTSEAAEQNVLHLFTCAEHWFECECGHNVKLAHLNLIWRRFPTAERSIPWSYEVCVCVQCYMLRTKILISPAKPGFFIAKGLIFAASHRRRCLRVQAFTSSTTTEKCVHFWCPIHSAFRQLTFRQLSLMCSFYIQAPFPRLICTQCSYLDKCFKWALLVLESDSAITVSFSEHLWEWLQWSLQYLVKALWGEKQISGSWFLHKVCCIFTEADKKYSPPCLSLPWLSRPLCSSYLPSAPRSLVLSSDFCWVKHIRTEGNKSQNWNRRSGGWWRDAGWEGWKGQPISARPSKQEDDMNPAGPPCVSPTGSPPGFPLFCFVVFFCFFFDTGKSA